MSQTSTSSDFSAGAEPLRHLGKLRHRGRHVLELRAFGHFDGKKWGSNPSVWEQRVPKLPGWISLFNAVYFLLQQLAFRCIVWVDRKHTAPGQVSSQSINRG